MPRRITLTDRQREALLRLPVDQGDLLKHYTLSDEDLGHIRQRRRPHNRFGFALQLCVLRYPGRVLAPGELIPAPVTEFIAAQLGLSSDDLLLYAAREETRHEHLADLRGIYNYRSFSGRGARDLREWIMQEAETATSNEDLAQRFVAECRRTHTILPASSTIERLCADALVDAERRIEDRIARMQEAPPAQAKPEPAKTAAAPLSPEAQAARKAEAEAREAAARERTAKAQAENRQLLQQLTTLDAMLKDQAKAVKELSGQFGTLQGAVTSTETLAAQQKLREKEMAQELAAERARREKEVKDKERELVRERERAREREAARERELAREREAVKEKLAAAEREAERQRVVSYRRDQSRPASTPPDAKVPSFTATGGTKSE